MRTIVKSLIILFGIVIVLAGTSLSLALIYRNEILKRILATVAQNNHISFETKKVDFILTSNLQNTKFLFKNVELKSKGEGSSIGNFSAQAESVGVEVDLLSFLLHKEVRIARISVDNGSLLLNSKNQKDRKQSDSDTDNLFRSIKQLLVENFIVYIQDGKGVTKASLDKIALHLTPMHGGFGTKAKGHLLVELLNTQATLKQPTIDIVLDADGVLAHGVLMLNNSKFTVEGQRLIANGEVEIQPLGKINLNLAAKNVRVEKALSIARKYTSIDELESASGKFDVQTNISGNIADGGKITLRAQGQLLQSEVQIKKLETINIHTLNYSLHSNNIKNIKSYSCGVTNASITYKGFELGGDVAVSSFGSPTYDATITFSGDVKTLDIEAIPEGKIMGSASIKAHDWSIDGVEKLEALADVSKLHVTLLKEKYIIDGEVFLNKYVLTPKVNIEGNIVSGNFEGKVQNYLPYLLDSKKPCEIKITGDLNANSLDLDKLFLLEGDKQSMLSVRLGINAQAANMLLFGEKCLNSSAKVYYDNSNVIVDKLKTNVYGGILSGDLKIYNPKLGSKSLNMDMYFNGIEIPKLTFFNKNFNIKPGSIEGSCDGSISLNSTFDEKGLDFKNAVGTINLTIQNGRLYEFEPIQALQGYIKKKLLQDIKFSALRNTISIENGAVIIPRMEIRSTALNTYISGRQMLNGDFDYHLTLFVSELLLQKNRNIENPIRDDKAKLFLRFTSKNGKRDVSLDSQEWGNTFTKKMQREAAEIQANSKAERGKENTMLQKTNRVAIDWDEQPEEEKPVEAPQRAEKTKGEKQKSDVKIEWDE